MSFKFLITALSLAAVSLAHAGKAERDFYAAEVEPAVKAATDTLKKSCGCDVKVNVNMSTLETTDHMRPVRSFMKSITDEAPKYCADAASKAAICKMKTLDVSRTKEAGFKFANGTGTATTDESSAPHWGMVSAAVDK